jgi:WD40 repeat protein
MPKISISYRRADSEAMTGRIFDRLIAHYGKDAIFRDIDDIPLGIDFRQHINETLLKTNILLAIVGPEWLGRRGEAERMVEEADPVRVEIETALRRRVPIIPVLIGNTKMPTDEQLPPGMKDFAFRNAVKVDTGLDFDYHMDRLIRAMDVILEKKSPPSAEKKIPSPPGGKSAAPQTPDVPAASTSKSHKIPGALVGALSFDRAKNKPSADASGTAATPVSTPGLMTLLWPPSRNGRIVRAAVAGLIVVAVAVLVFSGGGGALMTDNGKPLLSLSAHNAPVTAVAYSANSRMLVSGSLDRSVRIWDADSGQTFRTLQGDPGAVSSVAFLPDGHRIVSASLYGDIDIWNADTGRQILPIQSASNVSWVSSPSVRSLAISPDGSRLASASGGANPAVTIWSGTTGNPLGVFRPHSRDEEFHSVAFAPDGKTVAAGTKTGTVYVWDTLAGKLLHMLTDHGGEVMSVAISPDGKRLAAGGDGNAVTVWNAATGRSRSRRTADCSRSAAVMPSSNFLMPMVVSAWDRFAGTPKPSGRWHFRRTASTSRPAATTTPSTFGWSGKTSALAFGS